MNFRYSYIVSAFLCIVGIVGVVGVFGVVGVVGVVAVSLLSLGVTLVTLLGAPAVYLRCRRGGFSVARPPVGDLFSYLGPMWPPSVHTWAAQGTNLPLLGPDLCPTGLIYDQSVLQFITSLFEMTS